MIRYGLVWSRFIAGYFGKSFDLSIHSQAYVKMIDMTKVTEVFMNMLPKSADTQ